MIKVHRHYKRVKSIDYLNLGDGTIPWKKRFFQLCRGLSWFAFAMGYKNTAWENPEKN